MSETKPDYVNYQENLSNKSEIEYLDVDFDELDSFPESIAEFTSLRGLNVHSCPSEFTVPESIKTLKNLSWLRLAANGDRLTIPEAFFELPIRNLYVFDVSIDQIVKFTDLESLRCKVNNPEQDVDAIVKRFPDLVRLEVWGDHLDDGALPASIGELKKLEQLRTTSCGLKTLPAEFAQLHNLKTYHCGESTMAEVPLSLCQLPALETLNFRGNIVSVPDEFAQLQSLKNLSFAWSLNEGTMSGPDYSLAECKKKYKPIPAAIGKLPNLESLNMDCCGVWSVEPLFPLKKLKTLKLMYSGLESCDELTQLTSLEYLSLKTNYKLRDISPLTKLSLRHLDIESLYIKDLSPILQMPQLETLNIEGCSDIKDLTPIYEHPGLKTLKADDDLIEKWKQAEAIKALPSVAEITEMLESDDVEQVIQGIDHLAVYADFNSNDDVNSMNTFFELDEPDDDEELYEIEVLDAMLEQHIKSLPSESLVKLFAIGLNNIYTNFTFTLTVVEELIDRKDAKAQVEVGKLFHKACEYYDAGHRFWGDTVQDQLLDDYFPRFEPEGILAILQQAGGDMLNHEHGDGMDYLFVNALTAQPDPDTERKLVDLYLEYYEERIEYRGPEYFEDLTSQIMQGCSDKVKSLLEKQAESISQAQEIVNKLTSEDQQVVEQMLLGFGDSLSQDDVETYYSEIGSALRSHELKPEVLRHMLSFLTDNNMSASWDDTAIAQLFGKDFHGASNFMRQQATSDNTVEMEERQEKVSDWIDMLIYECHTSPDDYPFDIPALRELLVEISGKTREQVMQSEMQEWFAHLAEEFHRDPSADMFDALINELELHGLKVKVERDEEAMTLSYAVQSAAKHDNDRVRSLMKLFPYMQMSDYLLQNLATNIIICTIGLEDHDLFMQLEERLPKQLSNKTLAFNLSCYWALRQNTEKMMNYTRQSLELGKPRHSFEQDDDFAHYRQDTEFQNLISQYE